MPRLALASKPAAIMLAYTSSTITWEEINCTSGNGRLVNSKWFVCDILEFIASVFTCRPQKLVGFEMKSFTFLSDRHILLAVLYPTSAKLLVLNFQEPSEEEIPLARCSCALEYPSMNYWTEALHIVIRSDPMPIFEPKSDSPVPFYHENCNQLFVVTMWVHDGHDVHTVVLFVPTSTILAALPAAGDDKTIAWRMWGPQGTRMLTGLPNSSVWVCYVYGSRFVVSRPLIADGSSIEVYDFNQLACRRAQQYQRPRSKAKFIRSTDRIASSSEFSVFSEDVFTSLSYRKQTIFMEHKSCGGKIEAVMCTEDNLVVVSVRV